MTKLGLCEKMENPDRGIKVRYDFKIDEAFCSVADLSILEEIGTDISHVDFNNYFNHDEDKMELSISFNIKEDDKL
jgi:hypothetical protein